MLAFLGNPTYRSKAPSSNFHPSNSLDICWDVARLNIMKQPVEWVQRYSKICSKVKAAWKRLRHWIDMDWFQGKSAGKSCVFTCFYHQIYIFIYSFPAFTNSFNGTTWTFFATPKGASRCASGPSTASAWWRSPLVASDLKGCPNHIIWLWLRSCIHFAKHGPSTIVAVSFQIIEGGDFSWFFSDFCIGIKKSPESLNLWSFFRCILGRIPMVGETHHGCRCLQGTSGSHPGEPQGQMVQLPAMDWDAASGWFFSAGNFGSTLADADHIWSCLPHHPLTCG